jgi:chromosome segregation protein
MHLKSLTLKGFKSFASATTLQFEPGITCVVGPNGTGKSNVADALRWVMGTQGAKDLRGGKMEDVIFAGTSARAPLGRAEVSLTIDNTDGALPIDYTEVCIARRMFRGGAHEYEIGGSSCRLMDIQELLSDSRIGREMHVIVGQGQLSEILTARPEERRAFIEEAAGVLKHRKRKEKALRKLEATADNMTRLTDLTEELRRQLGPLGRQAEIARRAQAVQADLRDARLRLCADDLVRERTELHSERADEAAARARREEAESALELARGRQAELEASLRADEPAVAAAQDTWYRLSALAERIRGTARLAAERHKHLATETVPIGTGRDPDELDVEAERAAAEEAEAEEAAASARAALDEAGRGRSAAERAAAQAERSHRAAVRAAAEAREDTARLDGEVAALRSKATATGEEIERLSLNVAETSERAEAAAVELAEAEQESGVGDSGDAGRDRRHRLAAAALEDAEVHVSELRAAARAAEQRVASAEARAEALADGLRRRDGAGALLAAPSVLAGLLGPVAELVTVTSGDEVALAAALGPLADAVAVAGGDTAVVALAWLRGEDAGRAGLVIGAAPAGSTSPDVTRWGPLPEGARWAVELASAPESLRRALHRALERVAVVADLDAARDLVDANPTLTAVTAGGDVLGADWAMGGSEQARSTIEVQALVDEAHERRRAAEQELAEVTEKLAGAEDLRSARAEDLDGAKGELDDARVRRARFVEMLDRLGKAARAAEAEAERARNQREKVESRREQTAASLAEAEERLAVVRAEPATPEPDSRERDGAAAALERAREAEMDARLSLRTAEERYRAVAGRPGELRDAARVGRAERERIEQVRAERRAAASVAAAVRDAGEAALARIDFSLRTAVNERDAVQARHVERETELSEVRRRSRELTGEVDNLTDTVHRGELLRAEARTRVEALESRIAEEFGISGDNLVAEYGPELDVPPGPQEIAEYERARERGEEVLAPAPAPFDRGEQERRAKRASSELAALGKVNPLALEEFAALEERHKFLSTQLADLETTRADLQTVISDVDGKILEVFRLAFTDVAAEFETVFATLFPGGEGRLVLTEPDDLLASGVDVEARPPGKKIKRLSLLSGGEKSLVAVAMLVAIFRARPSPFYVLDEIEAALDETNLARVLELLGGLRSASQLLVITHQQRTMEIADALYGVSMRGDGITEVISQRLGSERGSTAA